MSKLQVDTIVDKEDKSAPTFSKGAIVTGVTTSTTFSGNLTGNVTGTLTGTASGLAGSPDITVGQLSGTNSNITGVVTATSFSGSGASLTGISQVGGASSVTFNDNVSAYWGTGGDLKIYHDGTNSLIRNTTGYLELQAKASEAGVNIVPDGTVKLYYDGSKKLETNAAGIVVNGGIYLDGAGGTNAANKFDDYETGTFTPVLTSASGTPGTVHGDTHGKYTKVGNRVLISLWISREKGSASGSMEITGLPFTAASLGATQWLGSYYWYIPGSSATGAHYGNWVNSICGVEEGGTTLKLYYIEAAKEQADAKVPNWDVVSGSYYMRVAHTFSYQVA